MERVDAGLFKAVLARDRGAWRLFVERMERRLSKVMRKAGTPEQEVSDLLGDLWLRLLDNDMAQLRTFIDRPGDLEPWLELVAEQLATNAVRKVLKETDEVAVSEPVAPSPYSLDDFLGLVVRRAVREELAGLRPEPKVETPVLDGYMTISAAAEIAGVHACTIREWIRDGSLRAFKIGRSYRLKRADLDGRLTKEAATPTEQLIRERTEQILAKRGSGSNAAAAV